MIKALLSALGVRFQKTHSISALLETLAGAGKSVPEAFEELETFTPFGAVYRYEDLDSAFTLDRRRARATLRALRIWVEEQIGTG